MTRLNRSWSCLLSVGPADSGCHVLDCSGRFFLMLGGTQNHLACRECQQTVEQWKQVLIVSQKFVGLGCERSHWGLFIASSGSNCSI